MARYGKESKLKPRQVLEKAVEFFGPGGAGLEVRAECLTNVYFEGSEGHVSAVARVGEKGSDIELETSEWDDQVQQFMGEI
jgi:hypothetical protein